MLAPPDRRRDLIHRRALANALASIETHDPERRRQAFVEAARSALERAKAELDRRFVTGATGLEVARARAYVVDQLLRVLFDDSVNRAFRLANPTESERLCLVAIGGYGRGELAPFSDVDLLFLLPYKRTAHGEQVIEHMLYALWDLGFKVGHAVRSVEECLRLARKDVTIATALLENRYLWGDRPLHDELRQRFAAEVTRGGEAAFIEAKLAERDGRHAKLVDSRYVLEPNLKEGKGGLRDLHTLTWIGKYIYKVDTLGGLVAHGVLSADEARRFAKAENFLWSVRTHLHLVAGRAEERLTFDQQPELARRMGYTDHAGSRGVERFMKHYFLVAKEVGELTRVFCAALEAAQKRKPRLSLTRLWHGLRPSRTGVQNAQGRLTVDDEARFLADPVNLLRLFWIADQSGLDIHPDALKLVRRNLKRVDASLRDDAEANRLFVEMLTSRNDPEAALRRLSEAGVMGRFVPDFGRVVAQMQYDMYHTFTVDEHTLFAVGQLARLERGDFSEILPGPTKLFADILSRRALYVAVLLHDIAKGRNGDHSILGEGVAQRLCPRLGLSQEETETVAWLVRYHLVMSNTAFRRDLQDPRTVETFVQMVQSRERLRLLYLLTIVDIRAVGPTIWNNWKASLLQQLFELADHALRAAESDAPLAPTDGSSTEPGLDEAMRSELPDWEATELDWFQALVPRSFWRSGPPSLLARHARLVRRARREAAPLALDTCVDTVQGVTELTVHTADAPGLFARIVGALAVGGANIVDARIFTLTDGTVLDSFSLQDGAGGAFARPEKLARLAVLIEQALEGRLRVPEALAKGRLPSRRDVFTVHPRVLVDNRASASHTVIEVNARDRPGLLHDIGQALADLQLRISSAKISTFGERAVDVFYVKDIFGLKIDDEKRVARISQRLLEALGGDPSGEARREPSATTIAAE